MEDNEIKGISEDTANELITAFEDLSKSLDDTMCSMSKAVKTVMSDCIMVATEKTYHYAEKYCNATFITKWYWKRKMKNSTRALKEIAEIYQDYLEEDASRQEQ